MKEYVTKKKIIDFDLAQKKEWKLASFDLEITARCNLDCRHCYIRLPPSSTEAKNELSASEISKIVDDAVELGALSCLITGGEPLLRKDFIEIYRTIRSKGLLVTVFTNGTLLTDEHVAAFKKSPPRFVELTVYGITSETYEAVTQIPGSYGMFRRGLALLKENNIPLRLKAMAVRSNLHEQKEIRKFCLEQCRERFRFDPFLHLRFDRDPEKNRRIESERLTPDEIVRLEIGDSDRKSCLEKNRDNLVIEERKAARNHKLFSCGAGLGKAIIGHDGLLRLCESLKVPGYTYDIHKGSLNDFIENFVPKIREKTSASPVYLITCRICPIINLCPWCPAHAYLEKGRPDECVEYFCLIAHARAGRLQRGRG